MAIKQSSSTVNKRTPLNKNNLVVRLNEQDKKNKTQTSTQVIIERKQETKNNRKLRQLCKTTSVGLKRGACRAKTYPNPFVKKAKTYYYSCYINKKVLSLQLTRRRLHSRVEHLRKTRWSWRHLHRDAVALDKLHNALPEIKYVLKNRHISTFKKSVFQKLLEILTAVPLNNKCRLCLKKTNKFFNLFYTKAKYSNIFYRFSEQEKQIKLAKVSGVHYFFKRKINKRQINNLFIKKIQNSFLLYKQYISVLNCKKSKRNIKQRLKKNTFLFYWKRGQFTLAQQYLQSKPSLSSLLSPWRREERLFILDRYVSKLMHMFKFTYSVYLNRQKAQKLYFSRYNQIENSTTSNKLQPYVKRAFLRNISLKREALIAQNVKQQWSISKSVRKQNRSLAMPRPVYNKTLYYSFRPWAWTFVNALSPRAVLQTGAVFSRAKRKFLRKSFRRKIHQFRTTKKLKWPRYQIAFRKRTRLSRQKYKKKRKVDKRAVIRKNYRNHSVSMLFKNNSIEEQINKGLYLQFRKIKKVQPVWAPNYKLVYRRWHAYRKESGFPAPRVWRTRLQKKQLASENKQRYRKGLKIKRHVDRVYRELEALTGSFTSAGYRRQRRVYLQKYNGVDSLKVLGVPNPFLQNVAALRNIPKSFRSSQKYRILFRTLQKLSETSLLNTLNSGQRNEKEYTNSVKNLLCIFDDVFESTLTANNRTFIKTLKFIFIKDAYTWLRNEPVQQVVVGWKNNDWLKLFNFYGVRISAESPRIFARLRSIFLAHLKKILFNDNLWLKGEIVKRALTLKNAVQLKNQEKNVLKVFTVYKQQLKTSLCADSILKLLRNNKAAKFTVTTAGGAETQTPYLQLRSNQRALQSKNKENSILLKILLRNCGAKLKKYNCQSTLIPTYEAEKNAVAELVMQQKQFPQKRRKSKVNRKIKTKARYDRTLRAFYRKVVGPRFKKRSFLRFRKIKTSIISHFVKNEGIENKKSFRLWKSRQAANSSKYLTARARKFCTIRTDSKAGYTTKKRLVSMPIKAKWKIARIKNGKIKNNQHINIPMADEVTLQYAIAARQNSRKMDDLVSALNKRRLPIEQMTPPWWKRSKKRGVVLFRSTLPTPYEARTSRIWTTGRLSLYMSSLKQKRKLLALDYGNSEMLTRSTVLRRARWARMKNRLRKKSKRREKIKALRRLVRKVRPVRLAAKLQNKYRKLAKLKKYGYSNKNGAHRLVNTTKQKIQPIIFQEVDKTINITTRTTLTPEEIKAFKIEQARVLAQFIKDINRAFPRLISALIKQQPNYKSLSKIELRNSIKAVYWSLRIFLAQDPFRLKARLKNKNSSALQALADETFLRSALPIFTDSELADVRFRLQPYKLHKKPSLLRGSLDWLRRHFPIKYFLFLEDAEEYFHLVLRPSHIFRSHPRRGKIQEWKTDFVATTAERTHRRLTTSKFNISSRSFENMLITNKRKPTFMLESNTINLFSPARTNFFIRKFSTNTRYLSLTGTTRLIDNLIQTKILHTPTATYALPATDIGVIKNALSDANNTREIVGRITEPKFLAKKFIDLTVNRNRSIRNQQYLLRKTNVALGKTVSRSKLTIKGNTIETKKRVVYSFGRRCAQARSFSLTPNRLVHWKQVSANVRTLAEFRKAKRRIIFRLFARRPAIPRYFSLKVLPNHQDYWTGLLRLKRFLVSTYKGSPKVCLPSRLALKANRPFRNKKTTLKLRRLLLKQLRKSKKERVQRRRYALAIRKKRQKYLVSGVSALLRSQTTYARIARAALFNNRNILESVRTVTKLKQQKRKMRFKELTKAKAVALSFPTIKRRFEIWNYITKLRYKKMRLVKTWVENMKYLLSRTGWNVVNYDRFKIIRSRVRSINWRESDRHFYRSGWQKAFTFGPNGAPWLQGLMYRRALYTTKRGEYRRYQFPREQKRLQWLQRFRRAFARPSVERSYTKYRRWRGLRTSNQRLQRSLFNIPNRSYARRIMKNKQKRSINKHWLEHLLTGWGNRLDVILLLLNIAPTPFWARELAPMGLLRVNGRIVKNPAFRVQPGDFIQWEWKRIAYFKHQFLPTYPLSENKRKNRNSSFWRDHRRNTAMSSILIPLNFNYKYGLQGAIFERLPRPCDLPPSVRLSPLLIKWFFLDSGFGK